MTPHSALFPSATTPASPKPRCTHTPSGVWVAGVGPRGTGWMWPPHTYTMMSRAAAVLRWVAPDRVMGRVASHSRHLCTAAHARALKSATRGGGPSAGHVGGGAWLCPLRVPLLLAAVISEPTCHPHKGSSRVGGSTTVLLTPAPQLHDGSSLSHAGSGRCGCAGAVACVHVTRASYPQRTDTCCCMPVHRRVLGARNTLAGKGRCVGVSFVFLHQGAETKSGGRPIYTGWALNAR